MSRRIEAKAHVAGETRQDVEKALDGLFDNVEKQAERENRQLVWDQMFIDFERSNYMLSDGSGREFVDVTVSVLGVSI